MERFKACLRNQLCDHRSMLPRDVVKLCYQAACGAEHLLSDFTGARAYFEAFRIFDRVDLVVQS